MGPVGAPIAPPFVPFCHVPLSGLLKLLLCSIFLSLGGWADYALLSIACLPRNRV
ncbi:unnamed protein product [Staurois parvus]|uniref:Uncharacterized protein n=1 Tax=Staurois parvus TaxID=386267 RepID=A0ABN9F4D2_9NEOB|nr:unnamed protein product [Staurois parvus]